MTYNINDAALAKLVYDLDETHKVQTIQGWLIVQFTNKSITTGYQGMLVKSVATGEYKFVSRGTHAEASDFKADYQLARGKLPDQLSDARTALDEAKRELIKNQLDPNSITLIGHSLGGAITQLLAAENEQMQAVTFNAYGAGYVLLDAGGSTSRFNNLVNHVTEGDPVSAAPASWMFGTTYAYDSQADIDRSTCSYTSLSDNCLSLAYFGFLNEVHGISSFIDTAVSTQPGRQVTIGVPTPQELAHHINLQDPAYAVRSRLGNQFIRRLLAPTPGFDIILTGLQALFYNAEYARSPLVLDLDGNGVETLASRQTGVHFDLDESGFAEQTGWVGPNDGLLVRDLNGDGQITSGSELFGNYTRLRNGERTSNGFEALIDLDDNADGVIDSHDAAFSTLRVWKDADSDGVSHAAELLTLAQAHVHSLNTSYIEAGKGIEPTETSDGVEAIDTTDAQGNQHRQTGGFTKTDLTSQAMTDVWFSTDTARTADRQPVVVSADIEALPDIKGLGNVASLHQVMARDSTGVLLNLLKNWQAAPDTERSALLTRLIFQWAGVQDIDPESRASTVGYGNAIEDARKLATLEAFLGVGFLGVRWSGAGDPNPYPFAAPLLLEAYEMLCGHIEQQLLLQTAIIEIQPLLAGIALRWNESSAQMEPDVDVAKQALLTQFQTDPLEAASRIRNFYFVMHAHGALGAEILAALETASAADGAAFFRLLSAQGLIDLPETAAIDADTFQAIDTDDSILGINGNDYLDAGSGNDNTGIREDNDILIGAWVEDISPLEPVDILEIIGDPYRIDDHYEGYENYVSNDLTAPDTAGLLTNDPWYGGSVFRQNQVRPADDQPTNNNHVGTLIQAMAGFDVPSSSLTQWHQSATLNELMSISVVH